MMLAQAMPSPFETPLLSVALCALAGLGTWLLMPRPDGSKVLQRIGAGLGLIAIGLFMLLMIKWVAETTGKSLGSTPTVVYFWLFSLIALVSSARVITHPQPVYSALYFVLTVFASAGLFVLMWAEFLAAALVIIYAGAILVTYTFVIMLASEASGEGLISGLAGKDHDRKARSPLLACVAGFVTLGVLMLVIFEQAPRVPPAGPLGPSVIGDIVGGTQQLGVYLFTSQVVALQIAGLILTLAMVGAILIARKRVLLSDEDLPAAMETQIAPYTPADDNPHSIAVEGEVGPRSGRKDRELAEL
jgi:NADH-quinone oxidoreductase subunit J